MTSREDAHQRDQEARAIEHDPREMLHCALCPRLHPADPEVFEATGMWVCKTCIEGHQ